jgi:hypothetical protein
MPQKRGRISAGSTPESFVMLSPEVLLATIACGAIFGATYV